MSLSFRLADVTTAAARVLAISSAEIERAERLKGGLTNDSWLVSAGDRQVVVRISTADDHSLKIDRMSESLALAAAQQAGVGPDVLLLDMEERLLVTRFLPGQVWSCEEARKTYNIRRLANVLARVHAATVPQGIAILDYQGILQDYWRTLERRGEVEPTDPWNRKELLEMARVLSTGTARCLCHNDVHHLNVVDAGRLWLLDWEYAGIGDPYFDLASVCCYHAYDEAMSRQLLHDYLGRDDDTAYTRLELACRLFEYIRRLWLAVRGGQER